MSEAHAAGSSTDEAWDAQKGKYTDNIVVPGTSTDNYLDTAEAWKIA